MGRGTAVICLFRFIVSDFISADDVSSYLELTLGAKSMIHSVTTQGSASAAFWVTSYKIQYMNYNASSWRFILAADGTERMFTGNTDQNTVVSHQLRDEAIVANKIRLLPASFSGRADVRLYVNACKLPSESTSLTFYCLKCFVVVVLCLASFG